MPQEWHQKQKAKGVKLTLGWFAPRNCWKKYRNKKTKYFHHPNSSAGYEAAVVEFYNWVQEEQDSRVNAAEYLHHISLLKKVLDWYERFDLPDEEEDIREEVIALINRLELVLESEEKILPCLSQCLPNGNTISEKMLIMEFCSIGIATPNLPSKSNHGEFGSIGWDIGQKWTDRLRQLKSLSPRQRNQPQTVGYQVNQFLKFKEIQVRGGVLKPRTWATLNERLVVFVKWIKAGTHVSTIDGTTLKRFYEWLLLKDSWGHIRKKGVFDNSRQWIRWAWQEDEVELEALPKNIDSKDFIFLVHLDNEGVSKETRTELLWQPKDLEETLKIIPEDLQLYLLLMLNCGFTNVDVASVLKSEINLSQGRIVRQRTKTRRHKHPPVVNYKLWPRTLELLRTKWCPHHPTLALTNRAGNPLGVSKLKQVNGATKATVWTSIGRRYGTIKKSKPKLPDKQLKYLRKSGSTKIKSELKYMTLDSLYLGHSWATVSDKHYNAFDGQIYAPLDEAIDWMGSEFNLI